MLMNSGFIDFVEKHCLTISKAGLSSAQQNLLLLRVIIYLISGKSLMETTDLARLKHGISKAGRGAQAWRSSGHDKGPSSEACYLGIRPLNLTIAL